jgi:hypothetical protein
MKISDLIPSFSAFKSSTQTALDETKATLAVANQNISDLKAKLEALEATDKPKAEDAPVDDSTTDNSQLDQLISDLQDVLDKYTSDETDDSTEDTSDDSTDDSTTDDSDDANDESAKAKANKVETLKALTKKAEKIVAASKKLKASVPTKVIQELAAIGIPTPIATKPDNKLTGLKGRARIAAAFNEEFNK